jgi:hypothetical protein
MTILRLDDGTCSVSVQISVQLHQQNLRVSLTGHLGLTACDSPEHRTNHIFYVRRPCLQPRRAVAFFVALLFRIPALYVGIAFTCIIDGATLANRLWFEAQAGRA